MKTLTPDSVLAVGEAAKLARCASKTLGRWLDAGLIPGAWRLPDLSAVPTRGDRRLTAGALAAFLAARGFPLPPELVFAPPPRPSVVFAADLPEAGAFFAAVIAARPGAARFSGPAVEVAHLAGRESPDAVVVGTAGGLDAACGLAAVLASANPAPAVAVVLGDDQDGGDPRLDRVRGGLKWVGRRPDSWQDVVTALGLTGPTDVQEEEAQATTQAGRARRLPRARRTGVAVVSGVRPGPREEA